MLVTRETGEVEGGGEWEARREDDAGAIQAVIMGETERYGELVERYQRLAYAVAWSRLGDHDLAEEAVQEAFVLAYQHLGALRRPTAFPAWLSRITRGVALRLARRRRRELDGLKQWMLERREPLEAVSAVSMGEGIGAAVLPEPLTGEESVRLRALISGLPSKSREALTLFYSEERPVRECADLLGISEGTFKVRLHRARTRLAEELPRAIPEAGRLLRRSASRAQFREQVLAGIMALSVTPEAAAGTAGAAGMGGTAGAKGLAGFVLKFLPLVSLSVTFGIIGWANRELEQNYQTGSSWRGRILRHGFWKLIGILVLLLLATGWIREHSGLERTYLAVGTYTGLAFLHSLWALRTVRTRFTEVSAAGLGLMTAAFLAMALLGWPHATFLATMLVYNLMLARVWDQVPRRADYSLFLRAAKGELGTGIRAGEEGSSEVSVGSNDGNGRVLQEEVTGFARFLGGHYLAIDHRWIGSVCRIMLPPIRFSGLYAFMPFASWWLPLSRIELRRVGTWSAWCSGADWKSLQVLSGRDDAGSAAALEQQVALTVAAAFERFRLRDEAGALALIQAREDAQVFKRPAGSLKRQRLIVRISVAAAGLALVAALLDRFF